MKKKKIIFCGGGTLGHILPIIPIALDIFNEFELYFIGTQKGLEKNYLDEINVHKYFTQLFFLDVEGINRKYIMKNIVVVYKVLKARRQLKKIYKKISPDLIIGMGGYISGLCIHLGISYNISTIIHEQNSVLGLANKLVYKKVDKLLLSYDIENIKSTNKKIIGNPRYSYVLDKYQTRESSVILIVGGSLGSVFINNIIIDNCEFFRFENYKIKLIVGKKYYRENIDKIKRIKHIEILEFLNDLVGEMSKASVIVSRAGATTISEIMALKKVSILIPSPNVTGNHQYYNALRLYNKGCCCLIEEKDLSKERLFNEISNLLTNYSYKKEIFNNIEKNFINNPKSDFIREIREEICKN